jgi:hypothetical protein
MDHFDSSADAVAGEMAKSFALPVYAVTNAFVYWPVHYGS